MLLLLSGALAGAVVLQRLESQALALATSGQEAIKTLSALAKAIGEGDATEIERHYVEGYDGRVLGDWNSVLTSHRDEIEVHTWSPLQANAAESAIKDRVGEFLGSLGTVEMSKLKLDSVETIHGDGGAKVRAILWIRGTGADQRRYEDHATLRLDLEASGEGWKLAGQELLAGETVIGPATGFREGATAAGVDFVARQNPRFSTLEWEPKTFGILRYGSAGVSAADYDEDGWDDILFADGAAMRLYRNQRDGTFQDVTAEVGLPTDLSGVNVGIFADFDNDDDQDLFLGVFTDQNRLYENDGTGHFSDVTATAGLGGLMVTVASAADYDRDGLLDLYVGRYLDPRSKLPDTLFYTRNGEGNSLLRNVGGLRFEDVTESAGVREGGLTLGVAWADYDEDGDDDIYVANDFGRNALLRNEADGTFSDVSAEAGALDFGFGMSSTWGDIDNDGDFDIYVSNVHSGQRWYGQAATLRQYLLTSLRQGTMRQDFPLYREIFAYAGSDWRNYGDRMVKGNSLLLNQSERGFEEVAEAAHANPFGWYWGSGMLDYDYDGRLDIYAANGWITGKTHDDL
ncbi:MAG: VCBS repeat-containing protein [Thermoanaerobaculia bacterium]|nr:VCBS repeat-containing protein [Thermoanaerobaculia bacterium]